MPTKFIKGGSVFSRIKDVVNKFRESGLNFADKYLPSNISAPLHGERSEPSKRFKQFLESEEGNKPITKILVCRKPLQKGITIIADALSSGNFSQKAKDLKYDNIYHNYTICTTSSNNSWVIEKNEIVIVRKATSKDFENENRNVPVQEGLTINKMIQNIQRQDSGVWKYNPSSNNCQKFQQELIEDSGLAKTKEIEEFINPQPAKEFIETLPTVVQPVPHITTQIASVFDRFKHGDGARQRIYKKRKYKYM
jgi:hypothetical protein